MMKDSEARTMSRFGWALAASLVLHALVLTPLPSVGERSKRAESPPLQALLIPLPARAVPQSDEWVTHPDEARSTPLIPQPSASPSPRPLRGKALASALAAVSEELLYPLEAAKQGLEGRVILLLHLDAAGRVTGVDVAAGSGHVLLDQAAVAAASRIGGLAGQGRQVLLPVAFRLE